MQPQDRSTMTGITGEAGAANEAGSLATPLSTAAPEMHPGDEAPEGTVGAGEDTCPRCAGSGKLDGGDCPDCDGTGIVIQGIGGG